MTNTNLDTMSWKDYLYIQKQDKTVIIILLFTIVLCGGFYITVSMYPKHSTTEILSVSESEKEALIQHADSIYEVKLTSDSPIKLREGNRIDINKADEVQLKTIPGIGAVLASRISTHRDSVGGYSSLEQLKEVKGIKQKLLDRIEKYIYIGEN